MRFEARHMLTHFKYKHDINQIKLYVPLYDKYYFWKCCNISQFDMKLGDAKMLNEMWVDFKLIFFIEIYSKAFISISLNIQCN